PREPTRTLGHQHAPRRAVGVLQPRLPALSARTSRTATVERGTVRARWVLSAASVRHTHRKTQNHTLLPRCHHERTSHRGPSCTHPVLLYHGVHEWHGSLIARGGAMPPREPRRVPTMPESDRSAQTAPATVPDKADNEDLAALAARYGLTKTTRRPSLPEYIRQLWGRRHFIRAYATARSKATYSSSRLGQIWQVITPLLNAAIYFFLFGVLLGTDRGLENCMPYLVTGVFAFTFTRRSLNNGAKSLSGNLSMLRALRFRRAVLPFSFVFVELRQLLISMVLLLFIIPATGVYYCTGDTVMLQWVLVIPGIAIHMLFYLGLCWMMTGIGAFSHEENYVIPFIQ